LGKPSEVKRAKKKLANFWAKTFPVNFYLCPISLFTKRIKIPTSFGFCVIALQNYRQIYKKYRKTAITLQKSNFSKI